MATAKEKEKLHHKLEEAPYPSTKSNHRLTSSMLRDSSSSLCCMRALFCRWRIDGERGGGGCSICVCVVVVCCSISWILIWLRQAFNSSLTCDSRSMVSFSSFDRSEINSAALAEDSWVNYPRLWLLMLSLRVPRAVPSMHSNSDFLFDGLWIGAFLFKLLCEFLDEFRLESIPGFERYHLLPRALLQRLGHRQIPPEGLLTSISITISSVVVYVFPQILILIEIQIPSCGGGLFRWGVVFVVVVIYGVSYVQTYDQYWYGLVPPLWSEHVPQFGLALSFYYFIKVSLVLILQSFMCVLKHRIFK